MSAIYHGEQFLVVEESRSPGREPPTIGKQLVNFISCGCQSSAHFL